MSRVIRIGAAYALSCVVGLMSGIVRAEEDPLARARELFSEARALVERGAYEEGCRRFEQSLKLEPGMGTEFNLADCWERIGRSASAQAAFERVAESARSAGLRDRERIARARARALEPRLARLLIEVPEQADLEVRRDGALIAPSALGAAMPIDPGTYQLEASLEPASGKKHAERWTQRIQISETDRLVTVTVPRLRSPEPVAPSESPEPVAATRAEQSEPRPTPERTRPANASLQKSDNRAWIIGLATLGAAGIATGTVFAYQFQQANDNAAALCGAGRSCTEADLNRHAKFQSDARAARARLFVGFGVGTAALASAALIYFTGTSSRSKAGGVQATPSVIIADGSLGVSAEGSF